MSKFRVDFDSLAWQPSIPGARFKVHREGTRQLRLVELTSEFIEPRWCEKGHIGFVADGLLEVDFGGQVVSYAERGLEFLLRQERRAHTKPVLWRQLFALCSWKTNDCGCCADANGYRCSASRRADK